MSVHLWGLEPPGGRGGHGMGWVLRELRAWLTGRGGMCPGGGAGGGGVIQPPKLRHFHPASRVMSCMLCPSASSITSFGVR
jgi:hypothetical protein